MPWLPHSDIVRESTIREWRAFDERVAQRRLLLRYDPAGVGTSRPGAFDFSVDALLAEIDAVSTSAGIERFAILASFHSGAAAITYAVAHPERVSHLILWCSYARGRDLRRRDELSSLTAMLGADWHVYSESAAQFLFAWEHQKLARQYASLVRESGTPELARAFVSAVGGYDVAELLPRVQVPTLVMHRPAMPWLDVRFAHELADGIPHARLALLDGAAGAPFVDDEAGEIACLMEGFLDQPGCLDTVEGDPSAARPR
jgi:pimeloyl-ACP methyl ester carboxylesterase